MERLVYEKSPNPYKVGDQVKCFMGGRMFFGRVVDTLSYEGSGLVRENALLVCEEFNGRPWPYPVTWGAVEKA